MKGAVNHDRVKVKRSPSMVCRVRATGNEVGGVEVVDSGLRQACAELLHIVSVLLELIVVFQVFTFECDVIGSIRTLVLVVEAKDVSKLGFQELA